MKKMLIIILSVGLFTWGGAAFAYGLDLKQKYFPDKGHSQHFNNDEKGDNNGSKVERLRDFTVSLNKKLAAVRQNQVEINRLRGELKSKAQQIRLIIENLKRNPDSLDAGRLNTIRQSLQQIQNAQQLLSATEGSINKKNADFKYFKQVKRMENVSQVLDDIIAIQEKRLDALNSLIAGLDDLNDELR